jgi:hypothetical protein
MVPLLSIRRFSVAGGGVIARGGVFTGGVFKALLVLAMCAFDSAEVEESSAAPIFTGFRLNFDPRSDNGDEGSSRKGDCRAVSRLLPSRHEQSRSKTVSKYII